jgi:hypothetical protein
MPTPHKPTPRWQPIASLPLIAHVIDGQLEALDGDGIPADCFVYVRQPGARYLLAALNLSAEEHAPTASPGSRLSADVDAPGPCRADDAGVSTASGGGLPTQAGYLRPTQAGYLDRRLCAA